MDDEKDIVDVIDEPETEKEPVIDEAEGSSAFEAVLGSIQEEPEIDEAEDESGADEGVGDLEKKKALALEEEAFSLKMKD